jgi:hypothetical protein
MTQEYALEKQAPACMARSIDKMPSHTIFSLTLINLLSVTDR